jgi:hypothetical protein
MKIEINTNPIPPHNQSYLGYNILPFNIYHIWTNFEKKDIFLSILVLFSNVVYLWLKNRNGSSHITHSSLFPSPYITPNFTLIHQHQFFSTLNRLLDLVPHSICFRRCPAQAQIHRSYLSLSESTKCYLKQTPTIWSKFLISIEAPVFFRRIFSVPHSLTLQNPPKTTRQT